MDQLLVDPGILDHGCVLCGRKNEINKPGGVPSERDSVLSCGSRCSWCRMHNEVQEGRSDWSNPSGPLLLGLFQRKQDDTKFKLRNQGFLTDLDSMSPFTQQGIYCNCISSGCDFLQHPHWVHSLNLYRGLSVFIEWLFPQGLQPPNLQMVRHLELSLWTPDSYCGILCQEKSFAHRLQMCSRTR